MNQKDFIFGNQGSLERWILGEDPKLEEEESQIPILIPITICRWHGPRGENFGNWRMK